MSPMLPEAEKRTRTSLTLLDEMLAELDAVAESTRETHPPNGMSRNDVIEHFLRWALKEYRTERETQRKKK